MHEHVGRSVNCGVERYQVEGANDVSPDGLLLMILAPVYIWSPGHTRGVQHMRRLDLVQLAEQK